MNNRNSIRVIRKEIDASNLSEPTKEVLKEAVEEYMESPRRLTPKAKKLDVVHLGDEVEASASAVS